MENKHIEPRQPAFPQGSCLGVMSLASAQTVLSLNVSID